MGLVQSLWQEGPPRKDLVRVAKEGAVPLLNYLLKQWAFDDFADDKGNVQTALSVLLRELATPELFGAEDGAKDWLAAFGAWCLRFVRQEREAGRLTSPNEPGPTPDPVRRAALAWHTTCELLELTPPVLCPRSGRWFPAGLPDPGRQDDLALSATIRALDEVGSAAAGRGYEVFFPTVYDDNGPGPIFVARMTALVPGRTGGLSPVLLAPWSAWGLAAEGRRRVSDLLAAPCVRGVLGTATLAVAFLLELEPAELGAGDPRQQLHLPTLPTSAQPVLAVQIKEQSHNLAHLIAAWAASHQRSLRRVCATCRVHPFNGVLAPVDGPEHKLKALRALAEARQQDVLFLVQDDQAVDLTDLAGPRVLVNGRRQHLEFSLKTLADLFRHPDLLADSFDEYRRALAAANGPERHLDRRYEPGDKEELDALVAGAPLDRSPVSDSECPPFACLFGTSPWGPAIYLLTGLANRIEESHEKEVGTAAELRVPLPLLLNRLGKGGEPADQVLAAIRAGLDELKRRLNRELFVDDLTLRNTVRFDPDKLLLLVVGEPSEGVTSYKTGPLKALNEYVAQAGAGRPAVLFIASDHHHELFLSRHWPAPGKPTEAGPGTHRRG